MSIWEKLFKTNREFQVEKPPDNPAPSLKPGNGQKEPQFKEIKEICYNCDQPIIIKLLAAEKGDVMRVVTCRRCGKNTPVRFPPGYVFQEVLLAASAQDRAQDKNKATTPPSPLSEKVPCKNCGALILPRTAKETGGFCKSPDRHCKERYEEKQSRVQRPVQSDVPLNDASRSASSVVGTASTKEQLMVIPRKEIPLTGDVFIDREEGQPIIYKCNFCSLSIFGEVMSLPDENKMKFEHNLGRTATLEPYLKDRDGKPLWVFCPACGKEALRNLELNGGVKCSATADLHSELNQFVNELLSIDQKSGLIQNARAREIGEILCRKGGYDLMLQAAESFISRGGNEQQISFCWHEIRDENGNAVWLA